MGKTELTVNQRLTAIENMLKNGMQERQKQIIADQAIIREDLSEIKAQQRTAEKLRKQQEKLTHQILEELSEIRQSQARSEGYKKSQEEYKVKRERKEIAEGRKVNFKWAAVITLLSVLLAGILVLAGFALFSGRGVVIEAGPDGGRFEVPANERSVE